ncbi:hypothetical protein MMC30_006971 [Trapelia coarctata]|nr:hypothetical protein [Trapelia coarctata]
MASFFSALRLRILNVISPASRSNGDGGRSGQQTPLERTLGGRVTKKSTKKAEKENVKHNVIVALQNKATDDDEDGVSLYGSTNGAHTRSSSADPRRRRRQARASRAPQILITPAKSETKRGDDRSEYGLPTPKLTSKKEVEETLKIEADEGIRFVDLTKYSHPHWSQSEIDLFNKLNNRGFETLLPSSFKMDFPTVPLSLFTDRIERTSINSVNGSDFKASRALSKLFPLGAHVRDRRTTGYSTEPILGRAITDYIKWSHIDAGLNQRDPIPALAVCCASQGETIGSVIARTEAELRELGNQYREEFRVERSSEADKSEREKEKAMERDTSGRRTSEGETGATLHSLPPTPSSSRSMDLASSTVTEYFDPPLPTLFGFAIYHMIVALFSYDSSVENSTLRTMALFDFGDENQDVWNSFALAMTVVWVRNFHVRLDWPLVELERQDDPDA